VLLAELPVAGFWGTSRARRCVGRRAAWKLLAVGAECWREVHVVAPTRWRKPRLRDRAREDDRRQLKPP
jgi:hypothetical protein